MRSASCVSLSTENLRKDRFDIHSISLIEARDRDSLRGGFDAPKRIAQCAPHPLETYLHADVAIL